MSDQDAIPVNVVQGVHRSDKGKPHRRPMNMRRKRFALELYAGKHPLDAMAIAGYTPRAENARRLANDPRIKALIGEMLEQERGLAEIEAMRARRERRIIAYADIVNYFEPAFDADGHPTGRVKIKDFTKLPHELTGAIRTIKPTKLGWEIGLHDKDASLRAIEDRVDPKPEKPSPEVAVTVNVSNLSNEQLDILEGIFAPLAGAGDDDAVDPRGTDQAAAGSGAPQALLER